MSDPIVIQTARPDVLLRQFMPEDAEPYFKLIDCNRPHLSQHLDDTSDKYPTLESVIESITNPKEPEKLRFGIWQDDQLVGTVNLSPRGTSAELGYWVGSAYTRQGFASTAARALCQYAEESLGLRLLIAFVHKDNIPSQTTLERCGFVSQGMAIGKGLVRSETAMAYRRRRQN